MRYTKNRTIYILHIDTTVGKSFWRNRQVPGMHNIGAYRTPVAQ